MLNHALFTDVQCRRLKICSIFGYISNHVESKSCTMFDVFVRTVHGTRTEISGNLIFSFFNRDVEDLCHGGGRKHGFFGPSTSGGTRASALG